MKINPEYLFSLPYIGSKRVIYARKHLNDFVQQGDILYFSVDDLIILILTQNIYNNNSYWSLIVVNGITCYLHQSYIRFMIEIKC